MVADEKAYLGMAQPESKLSRAIKAMIRARGGYCVKIHGSAMMEAGTPDILACIPVDLLSPHHDPVTGQTMQIRTRIGRFVGIETKMPSGGDPSPIQKYRHGQIIGASGVVIVPRSVQEAVQTLEALGMVTAPDEPS